MRNHSPGFLPSIKLAGILAVAVLCGCGSMAASSRSPLFGLRLGMDASTALRILNQPEDRLATLPYINGRRILHDTVALTECKLPFRRSFSFDSTCKLRAIGLTYKTPNRRLVDDRNCGSKWLSHEFGRPAEEFQRDSVTISAWNVAGAKLTLEAKSYDDNYGFVLIYLYPDSPSLTSVR